MYKYKINNNKFKWLKESNKNLLSDSQILLHFNYMYTIKYKKRTSYYSWVY